jgi:hypothetical protein
MEKGLTELPLEHQASWFEGYTWGLDEGRKASERLQADHKNEIQVLWHIIYGFRNDFTLTSATVKAYKPYVRALNNQSAGTSDIGGANERL